MSSLHKLDSDGEDSKHCKLYIVKGYIMSYYNINTFTVFRSSMTTGTMATTLLSTAPVNQVVHPRCHDDGQSVRQTDGHINTNFRGT